MTANSDSAIGRNRNVMAYETSQTFTCDPARLFMIVGDILQWPAEGQPRMLKRREFDLAQVAFADATRATLTLSRTEAGSGSTVEISHDLCTSLEQVNHWREFWNEFLSTIRSRVEL